MSTRRVLRRSVLVGFLGVQLLGGSLDPRPLPLTAKPLRALYQPECKAAQPRYSDAGGMGVLAWQTDTPSGIGR